MERATRKRNRKNNKVRKVPKVPIKTYRWEDIRRSRRRGGYPWTHLYKRPFNERLDPYPFTMDALRRSKSALTMGARSDGVDISEVSSFLESGKTTPSFLHAEFITEPAEDISAKHSRAGSEVIEEYVTEDEKDIEDDVQIKEFRTVSVASSDDISQYLDREDRGPGNSNSNQENGMEDENDDGRSSSRDKRAKSEETAKRKRKLSAESGRSRYSLTKLGVMKKLRDAKTKISDATSKIKVPKVSFPTKKILRKRSSPPKDVKKKEKSTKEAKKESKTSLDASRLRKTDKPVYIYIPLKPPPGETDEFSHLEFESKKVNGQNGLDNTQKSDAVKADPEEAKLVENTEVTEKTPIDTDKNMDVSKTKDDDSKTEGEDKDIKRKSPFSSLERGPRVTKKPPIKINPAFKQFLKDVRELKEKEIEDISKETEGEVDKEESKGTTMKKIDAKLDSQDKPSEHLKLNQEEQLDLEEQQTSDNESPKEDEFEKLFVASASKKEDVSLKQSKKDDKDPSSSSRDVRSRSAEPQRKRKSSIDSSYSRKSLSKLGIIKKLKEASEKIKGAFSLSSLKRSDSKKGKENKEKESKGKEIQEKDNKNDDKASKAKKHKLTVQEKLSQLGKPKNTEPVYIHIPLKPPPGVTDEYSHLEDKSMPSSVEEPKKEERTDSLDSISPLSTKNGDIQFIFLTPPSDDEVLDEKEPDIPETPSSDDNSPVFFGTLKKLAERVVDQISPETKRKSLNTVSEEGDIVSTGETEPDEKKDAMHDTPQPNTEFVEPLESESKVPKLTEELDETALPDTDGGTVKADEISKPIGVEKMIVDVEDGLNEPPKTEELKSVLKTSSSESTSPILKKKVSFKRKTKPTITKTDTDNGYEPIEAPKEERTVNLLEQAIIEGKLDTNAEIKESVIPQIEDDKKKFLVGDISQSMSVDEEKGYLDQKLVKDTSLEEDYTQWSKSGDHEYEPINPPDEVILMTSSVLPGVTVIDTDNEPKVVITATEILDKPIEEKKKSFFQFGRFGKEKVQGDGDKGQGHGGSGDDRLRSSQGQEVPEVGEQPKAVEGPNKFQAAFKLRTDQLKNKTNELRNKVRNIKKPTTHTPKDTEIKQPELKKSESKKPSFKKPEFKKPDFAKFKFERPKINLHLPKIPDTATIHLPNVSLPGAKKTTVTRTVEKRQYSTESNAGDSGSTKQRFKFDFDFSKTFPRFKKKKAAADDQAVSFGTTPRAKKDKNVDKRTTESSSSSIRIPLHSEDSMDAEDRLNYERENEAVRSGYEDRETSEDIDRSSRMRFDNDIDIEDEYERENQEINRAEYLNRWQHGNMRQMEGDDDPEDLSNEDERIVEQLVEQRFKKVGSGYGSAKQPESSYERYDDNESETLEERLRRDENRPLYSDDEEEFQRRLMQNKELITDLDNLDEEGDDGVRIRDGYSSEGSVSLQRKGRLGKLDINSDEFFVVHEIREGFQTPANALAQMNEYDPIGSNRSLPQAPLAPVKRKPIKKPKRKKTPHVSREEIPGDEESVDGGMLPSRPKRKSKKNKKKPDDNDGIIPYQKTIHLEHDDLPRGERLDFPRESLGILGDDEGDDHDFQMYENEKMQGKEQPEILVTDPYKQFQIMEQQMRAREEAATKSKEPSAPPRRHRSLKSLTQSENDSILTDKYLEPTHIEDYIIPAHRMDAPPSRPNRRSRSHTSSLSRVSLPPSQRDTDSLLADEAFLTENQPIPSYLIENQSYRQQYKGNQAIPSYLQEDQPIEPCVEEPCIQDMRDCMGYSIVDKSRQREPPLPPPRTPPRRRKRQIDPEQKFATVPRSVGSSQPEPSQPVRPLRNYSTLTQVQTSRTDSSHYENDKENRGNEIDIGQYIEIEEDLNRDLVSGDVVQKMRQRPLPAPPRPPRKTKTTRRSLQDITSKENIIPSSSSPQDLKSSQIVEETVSTQTEPLPPDFICEEIRQEPTDTIITARISEKVESTIQKRDISEPQAQKFEETEPEIRRELITPTVYSYEETVTHGSLLVEPLDGAKVVPDHQLSRERLVPVTKEYSDEETSEVPESFLSLRNPEEVKESQGSQKPSMEVFRTDKLQVADLDVDRLRVNELLASKIVVSEIDASSISANELQGKSGALRVGEIELPPKFLEEIVRKLEEIRPTETFSTEQRLQEAPSEEKKTSDAKLPSQSVQTLTEQQTIVDSLVDPLLSSADHLLSPVDPPLSQIDPSLAAVGPSEDPQYNQERLPSVDSLEGQHESTITLEQQELQHQSQHELSPEPPVPPPRSYTLEDTPPDAPPRTLRRKSKDSPRTIDTPKSDQSDTNLNSEKTDQYPQSQRSPVAEMLEPDIDDEPPPRPPEPLEGLYMPSQPPASFYALRAKQYVGLESENIPTAPRRKRHQKSRSRPVSRSRSTSDDSSVTPSHPQTTRSPRSARRFSEPSIPELSGRLIQACGSRINVTLKRLIYYLTENILRNADGKQDLHVFMIILLVLIAGLILLGYGEDKTVVHLHHWEYFNPPKDL